MSPSGNSLTLAILWQRTKTWLPMVACHFKRHALTWMFASLFFYVVHANYRLGYNSTPSLPYTFFLIHLNEKVVPGGFISFHWHGGKPFPDGIIFTKRLLAGPGDRVVRNGRDFIAGGVTLHGKQWGVTLRELYPAPLPEGESIVPFGRYFVAGEHEYSLDSRYSMLSYVDQKDVIGRAYPIF